jgi:hypothetical protein
MKKLLLLLGLAGALTACSEHDCKLETEEAKRAFGDVAGMTKGANHCFVSAGPLFADLAADGPPPQELAATHYSTTIDAVAKKYEAFLVAQGWEVRVEPHTGKRGNGEPYEGKRVLAKKGDRQLGTIVYELGKGIIDTTSMEIPKKK